MARAFSPFTLMIYRLVAEQPLVSDRDLLGMLRPFLGLGQEYQRLRRNIGRALGRGEEIGLLQSAVLGWHHRAVKRIVATSRGNERFANMPEFEGCRWLSDWDLESLLGLGPLVEMVYRTLPTLPASELFEGRVVVPRSEPGVNRLGEPTEDLVLRESNWRQARLVQIRWLPEGLDSTERALERHPFSLVLVYQNDDPRDPPFFLPAVFRGRYQRWQEFQNMRQKLGEVLERRSDWLYVDNSYLPRYCPGTLFICTDRVSGILARNHFDELVRPRPDDNLRLGVVDLQGNVVQQMQFPIAMWESIKAPLPEGPFGKPEQVLQDLKAGKTLAVIGKAFAVVGKAQWQTFQGMANFFSISPEKLSRVAGTTKGGESARPMVKARLASRLEGGYYLESAARTVLAASERVSVQRVTAQLGLFTRREPTRRQRPPRPGVHRRLPGIYHRKRNRRHQQGVIDLHLALADQGELVIPAKGHYIIFGGVRLIPDGYVLLPTGGHEDRWVLVAVEYERSAIETDEAWGKIQPYINLANARMPMAVLFVTETDKAAMNYVNLQLPHLMATSLDRLQAGPQGRALRDRHGHRRFPRVLEDGCWGYWYEGQGAPTFTAPINFSSASGDYSHWEIPADDSLRHQYDLRLAKSPIWLEQQELSYRLFLGNM